MKEREIKFRVYHQRDGMKYFGDIPVFILLNGDFFYDDCFGNIKTEYRINDSHKIMQYTGLKDSNGKEIFEGDILEAHQTINGQSRFVIKNCIGEFDLRYAYDLDRKYEYNIKSFLEIDELEIIGNIYENTELLNNL